MKVKSLPRLRVDYPLLVGMLLLLGFGLMMVYSTTWELARSNGLPDSYYVLRQAAFALAGLAVAAGLTFLDYHRLKVLVVPGMILTLGLLVAVLLIGRTAGSEPRRALLAGSIQPSELAKLMTVIYLAFWLSNRQEELHDFSLGLFPMLIIIGLSSMLILAQPDISAAATVILVGVLLFILGGGKPQHLLMLIVIAGILGVLVFLVFPRAQTRMGDYINGLQDPMRASDQIKWSIEALLNGKLFGVGLGRSTTKFIGLPVAYTDSIFAVIAEETGLAGAGLVLAGYCLILWRGMKIAAQAPDRLGSLLAAGMTTWIVTEAMINMAVMVNLVPVAGNPLPLVSYGGSNLVMTLAGLGIVLGVSRRSQIKQQDEERSVNGAVVDLRGRDGGRRVPSPVHSASAQR
jgi:cell division protein FtsW